MPVFEKISDSIDVVSFPRIYEGFALRPSVKLVWHSLLERIQRRINSADSFFLGIVFITPFIIFSATCALLVTLILSTIGKVIYARCYRRWFQRSICGKTAQYFVEDFSGTVSLCCDFRPLFGTHNLLDVLGWQHIHANSRGNQAEQVMCCSTRFCIRNFAIELVDKVLARERSTIRLSKVQQRFTITFVQRHKVSRVLFQTIKEVGKRIVHFFRGVDSTSRCELSNHQAQVIQRRTYFTVCRKLAHVFAILFRQNILGDDGKLIRHVLLQVSQEIICCIRSVRASANRCVQRAHEFHDTILGRRFTVVSRILHRAHGVVIFDQA